jgi:polyhydroxybutyrate depolymerase
MSRLSALYRWLATATLVACSPTTDAGAPPSDSAGSGGAGGSVAQAGTGGSAGASAAAGSTSSGGTVSAGTGSGGSSGGGGASTAGSAGQVSVDPDAARPSAGCGLPAAIEPGTFAATMSMGRSTWIRLPTGYDPMRAYPVIFVLKGCSAPGVASYGLENVAGADAIIASLDFPPGEDCYDTADGAAFVDLPVFDALLAQIAANHCADQAHVFAVGFSSGAWLTQLLGCQRGDVLRGIGTIAGGYKPAFMNGAAMCKGSGLSAFMVSDLDDDNNPFFDEDVDGDNVEIAVNHWLVQNGCTEQAWSMTNGTPAAPDMAVCRAYGDCGRFPVKLCLTSGKGHSAQESLAMPGFWQLFQESLPK